MLYSEWLDQDLVGRIQNKFHPIIFSLDSLGFGGNLSQLFFVNIPSIILRPDKYNIFNQFTKHKKIDLLQQGDIILMADAKTTKS